MATKDKGLHVKCSEGELEQWKDRGVEGRHDHIGLGAEGSDAPHGGNPMRSAYAGALGALRPRRHGLGH